MRGANDPMDVVTRAEFDGSMKNFPTKDDLSGFVSTVRETIKENLADLKVDLFAEIEQKVAKSHNLLQLRAATTADLKDVKNEILATTRRNINEAIAPLRADLDVVKADVATLKSDVAVLRSEVEIGFLKMGARLDDMHHQIDTVVSDGYKSLDQRLTRFCGEVSETLKRHESMLDRHDADLYKLRQSGVLH